MNLYKSILYTVLSMMLCCSTVSFVYAASLYKEVNRVINTVPKHYYKEPNATELEALRMAVWHMSQKEYSGALIQAEKIQYTMRTISHSTAADTTTTTYYIFQPRNAKWTPWGTYVFYNETDAVNALVEVPFPTENCGITEIAARTFVQTKAKALLIGGSRKGRCDVTTVIDSPYYYAHRELSQNNTTVLQFHSDTSRLLPAIVLSSGLTSGNESMDNIVAALIEHFAVEIYNGMDVIDFALTNNIEAEYTNSDGGNFVGLLLAPNVYASQARTLQFVTDMKDVFESTSSDTTTSTTTSDTTTSDTSTSDT